MSAKARLERLATGYAWVMLTVATLAHAVDSMARQGLPALGPFLQQDLGLSLTEVGLLTTAISLGSALTLVHGGRFADVAGVRLAMLVGLVANGVTVAALAGVGSFWVAFLCFIGVGLGHGPVSPAATKAAVSWFSARARGTAMSIKQTGIPMGGVAGALSLPWIAALSGWRTAAVALGLFSIVMGVLLYAIGREAPGERHGGGSGAKAQLGVRALWSNQALVSVGFIGMSFVVAQLSVITYAPLYARDVLGVSPVAAGGFLALAQAGGGLGRVFWGVLSDALFGGARRPVLRLIGLTSTVCALGMAFVAPFAGSVVAGAILFLFGFAIIGWTGVYMTLVGELVAKDAIGSAAGFVLLFNQVAVMVGAPIFGAIVDLSGSYTPGWLALAVTLGAATFGLVGRLKEAPERDEREGPRVEG